MFKLPEKHFKFLTKTQKESINWCNIDLLGDTGYLIECCLDYPKEIHDSTKDFPLCPQNITISFDMLSPFQKTCLQNIYDSKSYKQRKMTATFLPRENM
ncbi:MAG: hypothetical protein CXT79_06005 [Thaumarchaeota archaeon]|nr:MAG: hypothetical protein CXT79_06005 [Nitrososphaerota archaeon]